MHMRSLAYKNIITRTEQATVWFLTLSLFKNINCIFLFFNIAEGIFQLYVVDSSDDIMKLYKQDFVGLIIGE